LQKYCSKAVPKGGKRDLEEDLEKRGLEVRAKPTGYTEVVEDSWLGRTASDAGLWSGSLGTCPGIIVTGTPETTGGITRYLFHMSLQGSKTLDQFITEVRNSRMTRLNCILYTVDTRSTNPENRVPYMKDQSASAETDDYGPIITKLTALCGAGKVGRRYHMYATTGELSVGPNNAFTAS
jgi:hypothetical protein